MNLYNADCIEKMKELPENSVDSIVCDPPYELGFMGKSWDSTGIANNRDMWAECLRVLKPGGHLLAFSGTRTYHRMASAIEDAGFEVRDMIEWVYGSGFPKSHNVGLRLDQKLGLQGFRGKETSFSAKVIQQKYVDGRDKVLENGKEVEKYEGKSDIAKQYQGWGTALKPAHEPICMARKPLAEKTVAENVLKYGTGGINIDESRVGNEEMKFTKASSLGNGLNMEGGKAQEDYVGEDKVGRFPANLIHDNSEEVRECFPETKSGAMNGTYKNTMMKGQPGVRDGKEIHLYQEASEGNASRFFKSIVYIPKASKSERNKGLDSTGTVKYNSGICKEENMVAVELLKRVMSESIVRWGIDEYGENITGQCQLDTLSTTRTIINKTIELKILNSLMHSLTNESIQDANLEMENGGSLAGNVESLKMWLLDITKGKTELALGVSDVALKTLLKANEEENWKPATNFHATVKPIALMEYLINMVTREGQTVLDPFMGSGTTGVACKNLNRNFIGIELDKEYFEIAKNRIELTPPVEIIKR